MISKSPEINTFQKEEHLKRAKETGEEPNKAYIEMFDDWKLQDDLKEQDPEWQKDNLEYDLRSTDWILEKVRASESYAQNLYAAMCNMQFQQLEVVPILKNERWSCSWRHSGGIIANMRQQGDYMDWYCSGIRSDGYQDDLDSITTNQYVSEGLVTDEVRADLKKLGWVPLEWDNDE